MITLLALLGVGVLLSGIIPVLYKHRPRAAAALAVAPPAAVFLFALSLADRIAGGGILRLNIPLAPRLGMNLAFSLDGLGLLFLVLISGIGALVVVYGTKYLEHDGGRGRFYGMLLLFFCAMAGLVIADNLLLLFVFWELTSLSSYFLIGYHNERPSARAAALQALLVTGIGGMALLAGFLLLGIAGGASEISALQASAESIRVHPLYLPALLLILAGAFTKSAQFPFHFWLPGAMEAPTPVSAYLHSATMVKAGIYLLARLHPLLGGTGEWHYIVTITGAVTMFLGSMTAFAQTDLKRILAYTTVAALGMLTLLIGMSTDLAMKAMLVFLVVHSLYKGALFLVAGAVDHGAGTRNIEKLGGLFRAMPVTMVAASLAALSMAGLPPLLGFISKELLYEARLYSPQAAPLITGAGILANVVTFAVAGMIILRTFFGRRQPTVPVHEAPAAMLAGPVVLGTAGFFIGLFPEEMARLFIEPALLVTWPEHGEVTLALWHGINPVLGLSAATALAGAALLFFHRTLRRSVWREGSLSAVSGERLFAAGMDGVKRAASWCSRTLQNGYLRIYVIVLILTAMLAVGAALLPHLGKISIGSADAPALHEVIIALIMLAAAGVTIHVRSRWAAIIALGIIGYGVAMIFGMYGAPDLAMTQFAVETLTVVIFALVLRRLPKFGDHSGRVARVRDVTIAGAAGLMMTGIVLVLTSTGARSGLAEYFGANSLLLGRGRNVVNVILVDFRALDTLGEITVLGVAALGVFALLSLRPGRSDKQ